jgi:hypothetical protein
MPHPLRPDRHPNRNEHPVNFSLKDRHLLGAGAAACAVCCAAPILTLLGIAGVAATAATFLFAGAVFGLVVAAGTALAVWNQRRRKRSEACAPAAGPVDIELTTNRPGPAA